MFFISVRSRPIKSRATVSRKWKSHATDCEESSAFAFRRSLEQFPDA